VKRKTKSGHEWHPVSKALRDFSGSDDLGNGEFGLLHTAADELDMLAFEVERLRASLAGWQPMESAPKDGTTRVILVNRRYGEIVAAHWDVFDNFWNVTGTSRWVGEGWPDLWMPLPAPPVATPATPESDDTQAREYAEAAAASELDPHAT
jgi:hypothetical protein